MAESIDSQCVDHYTERDTEGIAPSQTLPQTTFYSIEYPGYVSTSDKSYARVVRQVGGQAALNAAFKRNATRKESFLELNLRPENPLSHPILGDIVGTSNLLLKVVKRRYRTPRPCSGSNETQQMTGEFTAHIL